MCLYPRIIQNKKYTKNKKNGGIIPVVSDKRVLAVPIGCGKCMECKKQKGREWQVRLTEDVKHNTNGIFVTLTFSNESIQKITSDIRNGIEGYELDNEIARKAVRKFLERWRKHNGKSVRHWLVTELGHEGTENIHLHGIIWTDKREEIEKHWQYGYIWLSDKNKGVGERVVNYITKYIIKQDLNHKNYNPIILTSKGIGKDYTKRLASRLNKFDGKNTKEYYKTTTGHKMSLPIYWRNKIYSEEEREKLWLIKLDKEVRYVGGEEIDVSKGNEEYYESLEYYRKKNEQFGFGTNEKDWNQIEYEKQRRILNYRKRLNNDNETLSNDIIKAPVKLVWDELEKT